MNPQNDNDPWAKFSEDWIRIVAQDAKQNHYEDYDEKVRIVLEQLINRGRAELISGQGRIMLGQIVEG